MALLEGLSEEVLQTVAENLPIKRRPSDGLKILRIQNSYSFWRFYLFWELFAKELGIDYTCKRTRNKDGKLTGDYMGEIVDGKRKPNTLQAITDKKVFISIKPLR
jgi:phosphoserine phosphatase